MQQLPTNKKQAEKIYKKWVLKADIAARKAKELAIKKEKHPEYIAADNMAKNALIAINRFDSHMQHC